LPICYRNTPWALTLAHALGFGIYRQEGLVQHFDDNSLWSEIGYEIIAGKFQDNCEVTLRRETTSYPEYFNKYLSPSDAVSMNCFSNFDDEVSWIAEQVKLNLTKDELDHEDILIILPDSWTAKSKAKKIMEALKTRELDSHLSGVSSSVDKVFVPNSIAIANIHRAKGNEAPMVYVANCDYCTSGIELIKLRNSLFTAITRSRAWVRLTGAGEEMQRLELEYNKLKNNFQLKFILPNEQERKRVRTIHRDRTESEKAKIKKATDGLRDIIEMLEKGELTIDSLSVDIRNKIRKLKHIEDQNNEVETN
ncbi:DEAD/DEAH box helicase, partial [bacterium]|nr:DEAD/DEAH box helicase [bacterium]